MSGIRPGRPRNSPPECYVELSDTFLRFLEGSLPIPFFRLCRRPLQEQLVFPGIGSGLLLDPAIALRHSLFEFLFPTSEARTVLEDDAPPASRVARGARAQRCPRPPYSSVRRRCTLK